jgi:L-lactate dehydrogenase
MLQRRLNPVEEGPVLAPFLKPSRVAVVGAGLVGSTYAYTVLLEGIADEICLIDVRREKARGEAMDLSHAVPFTRRTAIWAGTMDDLEGANVIMISAGAAQEMGESRMQLLRENARIVGDVAEQAGELAPGAVLLVTTNPVDAMSYVAMKRSKAEPSQVIGSGTALDTARLRLLMGANLGIDPRSIHAFVLGEHGDSEMVAWSRAQVAGTGIEAWQEMDEDDRRAIEDDVRTAAYKVIRMKGATCYAIGLVLARITEAILKDSRTVFSVSTYLSGEYGIYDVYLGVPAVVGREGVLRTIEIPLSKDELARLQESGRVVRDAIEALDLGQGETTASRSKPLRPRRATKKPRLSQESPRHRRSS